METASTATEQPSAFDDEDVTTVGERIDTPPATQRVTTGRFTGTLPPAPKPPPASSPSSTRLSAPPPMRAPSVLPPLDSPPPVSAESMHPATVSVTPQAPGRSRLPLYGALSAAAVLLVAVVVFFSGGGTGKLVVSVAGPGGVPLSGVRVYVDQQLRCEASPCVMPELDAASHLVEVEAEGFSRTAAQAVVVKEDEDTALNVPLTARLPSAEPKEEPVAAAEEKAVPVAELETETDTSDEQESAGGDSEEEDDKAKSEETEQAEAPAAGDESEARRAATSAKASAKHAKSKSKTTSAAKAVAGPTNSVKATNGTLNLNSIPSSTVILNGRPLGKTPRMGISVKPGTYTVVFVHAEKGRKRASAKVSSGDTRTVSVRF